MNLDLIAIGAINYDCIFFCKKGRTARVKVSEPGTEQWEVGIRDSLYLDINTLKYSAIEYATQIGGSAFLALKAAFAVDPGLHVSYVGVCGTPTDDDERIGFVKNDRSAFDFLCDKSWLFFDDAPPGLSVVRLNEKNERDDINIDPGANDKLEQLIKHNEVESGQSFVDFLCTARWIHLSSLADFNQFMFIVEKIQEAKIRNPLIKVSIDPGFHYAKNKKVELRSIFNIADFVFLNEIELGLLISDDSISDGPRNKDISAIFNHSGSSNTQVLVIKSADKNAAYSFFNGDLHVATFWHKRLRRNKIVNDTGAGDAFAGGFIAAALSPRLAIHQRFPIEIGAQAATARLICRYDPSQQIAISTSRYIQDMQRRESFNAAQKRQALLKSLQEHIPAYICGVVTGLIVWGIQIITKCIFG